MMTSFQLSAKLSKDLAAVGVNVTEELLRQILSNYHFDDEKTEYTLAGVHYDTVHQQLGNHHLTSKENSVLQLLVSMAGQDVERTYIMQRVWRASENKHSRCLSVYMNLVKKILAEEVPSAKIETIGGHAYRLIV